MKHIWGCQGSQSTIKPNLQTLFWNCLFSSVEKDILLLQVIRTPRDPAQSDLTQCEEKDEGVYMPQHPSLIWPRHSHRLSGTHSHGDFKDNNIPNQLNQTQYRFFDSLFLSPLSSLAVKIFLTPMKLRPFLLKCKRGRRDGNWKMSFRTVCCQLWPPLPVLSTEPGTHPIQSPPCQGSPWRWTLKYTKWHKT